MDIVLISRTTLVWGFDRCQLFMNKTFRPRLGSSVMKSYKTGRFIYTLGLGGKKVTAYK